MSYGIQPFAVSLEQIEAALAGAKKKPGLLGRLFGVGPDLVRDIKRTDQYLLQDDELDEDGELTIEQALRDMIAGARLDGQYGWKYAYALKALCWHFGEFLDNSEWATMRRRWSEQVDHALGEAGVPEQAFSVEGRLMFRGSPIPIPDPMDFPFMGYLRRSELPEAVEAISQCDFAKLDDEVRPAVRQIEGWLARARQLGCDIFCFYH